MISLKSLQISVYYSSVKPSIFDMQHSFVFDFAPFLVDNGSSTCLADPIVVTPKHIMFLNLIVRGRLKSRVRSKWVHATKVAAREEHLRQQTFLPYEFDNGTTGAQARPFPSPFLQLVTILNKIFHASNEILKASR